MDKYDAKSLKSVLLVRGWMANRDDPLFAYSAGALLDDEALTCMAAEGCLSIERSAIAASSLFSETPALYRVRLEKYQVCRSEAAFRLLSAEQALTRGCCSCTEPRWKRHIAWNAAAKDVSRHVKPDIDVVKEMSDKLLKSVLGETLCSLCSHNLCSDMKDFQEAWAAACAKITLF
ncbi:hypothetical protein JCM10449v2_005292 [Rhodotorula kratochvilovae]